MLSQQQRQWFGYMREAPLVFVFYVCVCLPLIVLFSTQAPVVVNSQPQVMSVIEKVRPEYVDVEVLKRVPLFGVVDIPSPVIGPTIKVVEVIETALELTLRGLFTSTNKLAGQAIIAGEFDDKLYKVGESFEILPNVVLVEVFPDRVTLNNNGNMETLFLYPEDKRESPPLQESYDDSPLSSFVDDSVEYELSDEKERAQYEREQGILP